MKASRNVRAPHKKVSSRRLKWLFFRKLCQLAPALRSKLLFFDQGIQINRIKGQAGDEIVPIASSRLHLDLDEAGKGLTEEEKTFISQTWNKETDLPYDHLSRQEDIYLLNNISVLGHTGAIIKEDKVVLESAAKTTIVHHNLCKPLKKYETLQGDEDTLYISMLGLHAGHKHFYHFFMDYLAEAFAVLKVFPEQKLLEDLGFKKIVFLVRDDLASFQQQAYDYILETYPFITLQVMTNKQVLKAPNCLYIDIQQNIYSAYLAEDYIAFLKKIFTPDQSTKELSGKYYISRGDVKNRHVENEAEIIAYLESRGFETLLPATLPLKEQARIFATAEYIIAGAGAALTNLIYCHPETKVIVFYPSGQVGSHYLWLAKAVGIKDIRHIISNPSYDKHQHFEIPLDDLKQALDD